MNAQPQNEAAKVLIIKLGQNSADIPRHVDWLARLMMVGVESYGVLSAEIVPPSSPAETEWTLVQRFLSPEQIEAWRKSDARRKLMDEITPHLDSNNVTISESVDSTFGTVGSVAVAVVTHVKDGQQAAYCACEGKYQSAQAQFPGYRGAYVQPPTKGTAGMWTTLIRFDSPGAMDRWFASEERKKLLTESDQLVSSTDFQTVATSFPGWFPAETKGGEGPPNWKTAMLILLGLYPVVMLELKFLNPLLHGIPPALANFLGNIVSVALTTWVTMPASIKAFKVWLFPTGETPKWVNSASVPILVCLYAIEIALLWRLL